MTPDAIQKWKAERGYDKPLLWNEKAAGAGKIADTIFFQKSIKMFAFDFGRGGLKGLRTLPHFGGIVDTNEEERVERLFRLVRNIIDAVTRSG